MALHAKHLTIRQRIIAGKPFRYDMIVASLAGAQLDAALFAVALAADESIALRGVGKLDPHRTRSAALALAFSLRQMSQIISELRILARAASYSCDASDSSISATW